MPTTDRWRYLRGLFQWLWGLILLAYAGLGFYDFMRGEFWDDGPALSAVTGSFSWHTWLIGLLFILVAMAVEGGYRQYRAINEKLLALEEQRPLLIGVTPNQAAGRNPVGGGNTVSEVVAYLDVAAIDENRPLRNCRVKLRELEHYFAWTDKSAGEVKESWGRDSFYVGHTYFFTWSGRGSSVDAIDIQSMERASIARCINTVPELTTTAGKVGHLFHGDQYRLTVEITADNSRPLTKSYWLQMHAGKSPVIKEWDDSQTSWL
ncbi:MAG: hypothetical protein Q7T33_03850 [Dehalococcoidia bacterium]|nr:hypothetical protein [Dehalococcoidia bacterium]